MQSSRHLLQEGSMTRKDRQCGVTMAVELGLSFEAKVAAWS
jgi:hypothetical protein